MQGVRATQLTKDYFPRTVGSSWVYANAVATWSDNVISSNGNAFVIAYTYSGSANLSSNSYVVNDNGDISISAGSYSGEGVSSTTTYSPGGIVIPGNLSVGTKNGYSYVVASSVDVGGVVSTNSSSNSVETTIEQQESVTVPAGTFSNCLKISYDLGASYSSTAWFALGVGLVKSVSYNTDGTIGYTTQLQSYVIR